MASPACHRRIGFRTILALAGETRTRAAMFRIGIILFETALAKVDGRKKSHD